MAAKLPIPAKSEALRRRMGPPSHVFYFDNTAATNNIDDGDTFAIDHL